MQQRRQLQQLRNSIRFSGIIRCTECHHVSADYDSAPNACRHFCSYALAHVLPERRMRENILLLLVSDAESGRILCRAWCGDESEEIITESVLYFVVRDLFVFRR